MGKEENITIYLLLKYIYIEKERMCVHCRKYKVKVRN